MAFSSPSSSSQRVGPRVFHNRYAQFQKRMKRMDAGMKSRRVASNHRRVNRYEEKRRQNFPGGDAAYWKDKKQWQDPEVRSERYDLLLAEGVVEPVHPSEDFYSVTFAKKQWEKYEGRQIHARDVAEAENAKWADPVFVGEQFAKFGDKYDGPGPNCPNFDVRKYRTFHEAQLVLVKAQEQAEKEIEEKNKAIEQALVRVNEALDMESKRGEALTAWEAEWPVRNKVAVEVVDGMQKDLGFVGSDEDWDRIIPRFEKAWFEGGEDKGREALRNAIIAADKKQRLAQEQALEAFNAIPVQFRPLAGQLDLACKASNMKPSKMYDLLLVEEIDLRNDSDNEEDDVKAGIQRFLDHYARVPDAVLSGSSNGSATGAGVPKSEDVEIIEID